MDCLLTKLKGTVNDDTLMKIGEIRIVKTKATEWDAATQKFSIQFNKDVELEIVGDGYFTDKTGSSNLGKTQKITANTETGVYVSNSDFEISIPNKYALTKLRLHYQSSDGWSRYPETKYLKGGLSALIYATNLEELGLNAILNLGDISFIKNLTKLTRIDFTDSSVTGDISALSGLTALTDIVLSNTQVTGDILALQNLTALTDAYFTNTQVTGDISALSGLKALTDIRLSNTQVTGDISALSGLTALTIIRLYSTQVTGDISALQNLTALTGIHLYSTQVTGDISALSGLTALTDIVLYTTNITGSLDSLANLPSGLAFDMGNETLTGDYFKFLNEHTNSAIVCSGNFSYTTKSWSGKSYRRVGGDEFTCNNLDNFLNDFQVVSVSSIGGSSPSIKMKGTRTSASDDAISALQGKGFTVTVSAATDASSLILMSVNSLDSGNYGIAYKDKELIVEPVDLSKMQIYPASDVTVKKFDTPEDAEKFIKGYGLVKA